MGYNIESFQIRSCGIFNYKGWVHHLEYATNEEVWTNKFLGG